MGRVFTLGSFQSTWLSQHCFEIVSNQQLFILLNGKNTFPSWLNKGLNLGEEKET